jgi:hypothetical protein
VSYAPMPPTPAMPTQPQRKNGLGTAGFVLGLVGLVFAFIPLIGVIAWPLTILGLIFGILGITRASRGQADNKGLAITGVVLSAIGLVICVIWTAAFGNAVTDSVPTPAAPPSIQASGAPAGRHTVVLEVTTAAKSNLLWTSGYRANSQEVLEPGKTWSQTLSMDALAWTSVSVSPVSYAAGGKDNTCKITVDGKTVSEQANGIAALCTFQP